MRISDWSSDVCSSDLSHSPSPSSSGVRPTACRGSSAKARQKDVLAAMIVKFWSSSRAGASEAVMTASARLSATSGWVVWVIMAPFGDTGELTGLKAGSGEKRRAREYDKGALNMEGIS